MKFDVISRLVDRCQTVETDDLFDDLLSHVIEKKKNVRRRPNLDRLEKRSAVMNIFLGLDLESILFFWSHVFGQRTEKMFDASRTDRPMTRSDLKRNFSRLDSIRSTTKSRRVELFLRPEKVHRTASIGRIDVDK